MSTQPSVQTAHLTPIAVPWLRPTWLTEWFLRNVPSTQPRPLWPRPVYYEKEVGPFVVSGYGVCHGVSTHENNCVALVEHQDGTVEAVVCCGKLVTLKHQELLGDGWQPQLPDVQVTAGDDGKYTVTVTPRDGDCKPIRASALRLLAAMAEAQKAFEALRPSGPAPRTKRPYEPTPPPTRRESGGTA